MNRNKKEYLSAEETYNSALLDNLISSISPEEQEQTDYKMKIAAKIYFGVQKKGWTQTHLAELMGKSISLVSRWLSGTHNFTVDTLVDIQRILGINLLDVEEYKDKTVVAFKLTVSADSTSISPEDIQHAIDTAGGMSATAISSITLQEKQW